MSESRALDRIDRAIVAELQNDGRLSNKELAGRVGLAPSSCLERVRRLERAGTIRGYRAVVALDHLGLHLEALVEIQLGRQDADTMEQLRDSLLTYDEVRSVYHVSGVHDLVVHVAVRDTEHLRQLVFRAVANRPEVRHVETSLVFEHARFVTD